MSLLSLIKHIQIEHEKMSDPKIKKKMSTNLCRRRNEEIRLMKMSVTERLKKLDRNKPEFFPIGVQVVYKPPFIKERMATVEGYADGYVVIRQDNEEWQLKVEPKYLKINNLRVTYS